MRRESRLVLERRGERGGRLLCLLDALRRLGRAKLRETRTQLGEVAAARALLGDLAERRERCGVAHEPARGDRARVRVQHEPGVAVGRLERTEVDARALLGLDREDAREPLALSG